MFIDGGFEPDFILWIKHQGEQQVVFIDPKGLRHHTYNDPKVNFYLSIQQLQTTLHANNPGMQHIRLHSFLVSQTRLAVMESIWGQTQSSMEDKNILFPDDDDRYMEKLVAKLGL